MDYNKFENNTPLVTTDEREQASHIKDCVTLLTDNKERTKQAIQAKAEATAKQAREERLKKLEATGRFRRKVAGISLSVLALAGTTAATLSAINFIKQHTISKDISNRADGYTVEEIMSSPVIDYITADILCPEEIIYEYFTAIEKYENLANNPYAQKLGTKEASDLAESAQYIQGFTQTVLPSVYTQAIKENIALATNLNSFENKPFVTDEDIIHHTDIRIKTSTVDNHPYIVVNEEKSNSFGLHCTTFSNDIPLCYKTAINDVVEITGKNATDNLSLEDCIEYGKNFKGLLCTYLIMDSKGNFREADTETFIEHTKNVRSNLGLHYDINSIDQPTQPTNSVQTLTSIQYENHEENER